MKGYGAYIREAREREGMTPEALAKRMGRTKSTVYRIEDETTEPSVAQIQSLVALLSVPRPAQRSPR